MPQFNVELPPGIEMLLMGCPQTGSGERLVHRWILRIADRLRHYASETETADLIRTWITRPPKPGEIEEAVSKAYGLVFPRRLRWELPKPDPALVASVTSDRIDNWPQSKLAELIDSSPVKGPFDTASILETLFGADALVCVGLSPHYALTRPLKLLKKPERFPLVVPNAMTARTGLTFAGTSSERCLNNTGVRKFLVLDFDLKAIEFAPLVAYWEKYGVTIRDAQAALIDELRGPLVMVVFSGHHSLQAWFYCSGESEDGPMHDFFCYAVKLGADPIGWNKTQFMRMPQSIRPDTGGVQQVYYFDPSQIRSI